jgi:hypothetical protein
MFPDDFPMLIRLIARFRLKGLTCTNKSCTNNNFYLIMKKTSYHLILVQRKKIDKKLL